MKGVKNLFYNRANSKLTARYMLVIHAPLLDVLNILPHGHYYRNIGERQIRKVILGYLPMT